MPYDLTDPYHGHAQLYAHSAEGAELVKAFEAAARDLERIDADTALEVLDDVEYVVTDEMLERLARLQWCITELLGPGEIAKQLGALRLTLELRQLQVTDQLSAVRSALEG